MRILIPSEAARTAGVAVSTLKLWTDEGKLPVLRTPTGHRLIVESDLHAFLERRAAKHERPAE